MPQCIKAMIEVSVEGVESKEDARDMVALLPGYILIGHARGRQIELHVQNVWVDNMDGIDFVEEEQYGDEHVPDGLAVR